MRASRGLLATVGVSTCLVLAGTMALLSVSAVVAFRGWPGLAPNLLTDAPTKLAGVSVRPVPPRAGSTRTGSLMLASAVSPASRNTLAQTSTEAHYAGGTLDVAEAVRAPARPPTIVAAAPTGPVVVRTPAPAQPQVQETVRKVGGGLGAAVQDTGNQLGDTVSETGGKLSNGVQPISPELAVTLDRVTKMVGNVVKALGGDLAVSIDSLTR